MNTQDSQIDAAVHVAAPTRTARAAIHIRTDTAAIPNVQLVRQIRGADVEDFDGQFMSQDTRIAEKGLVAREGVQIGPADADAVNTDLYFILPWLSRRRSIE
jgi:hypothetical protein